MILATSLFRVVTKNLLPGKQPRLREFSSCSHFVESSFHTSSRTSKNLFPLSDSCILSSKACNSIKSWADPTRASRIALAILISSKGISPCLQTLMNGLCHGLVGVGKSKIWVLGYLYKKSWFCPFEFKEDSRTIVRFRLWS
uniref:Uncharacterized protein n=1 Tax=Salix viminalis TaxID=40686 RepID=A0A6N2KCH9_SALVM